MAIWKRDYSLQALNDDRKGTVVEHMGIVITAVSDGSVSAEMPVDKYTLQSFGRLHGGVSVLLAETLAGLGAELACTEDYVIVGLEINANHVGSAQAGDVVVGIATAAHVGRTTQVWNVQISHKETGKLVCVARMTTAVLKR